MIGRVLRALLGNTAASVPPPLELETSAEAPPADAVAWAPGNLARCITSDWLGTPPPQGYPTAERLYRVSRTGVMFSTMVGRPLLMLEFDDMPGVYAAAGFEKIEPDCTAGPSWFTDELRSVSARVKARAGGA
jgi:hypothetical protein